MTDGIAPPKALDRRLWRQFFEIARPFWSSDQRWRGRGMLALLLALLLGQTWLSVLFNEQTGEFTSALAARDPDRFWQSMRASVVVLLAAAPVHAWYYYVRDTLGVFWRRWMTNQFAGRYFTNRAYYELNGSADIDNPDQRIAEDIRSFTEQSLYFLLVVLGALVELVAFTGVLWSISQQLVYFLIGYAVFGTLVTVFVFGKRLVDLNYQQLRREADFRFGLVRVREHAEAIALLGGEAQESSRVRRLFEAAFANFRRIVGVQLRLNMFQYGFGFVTVLLPSAIIAADVISGQLEVGRAIQAAGAFTAILTALSIVVDHFENLSRFAAGVDRLHGFARSLQSRAADQRAMPAQIEWIDDSRVAIDHLTLLTPDRQRELVRDLSVAIDPGAGLMIVGASGVGKSSLLRAVAGLWNAGAGRIARPRAPDMLFLPQQPYMTLGSLRAQLLYPDDPGTTSDEELQMILQRLNLPGFAQRFGGLHAELDWGKVLSVGEQQRVAFARVLLARPRFVMLDEASSALDAENERLLYEQLAGLSITPISISHRGDILRYHRHVLELTAGGRWRVVPAHDYRFEQDRQSH